MKELNKEIIKIAVPITIQSLFQASLSVIDQIMVGQLGKNSIAGIGLGGKFSSIFTVTVAAVATALGIMTSQYYGSRTVDREKAEKGISDSFHFNLSAGVLIAVIFTVLSMLIPVGIMNLYSEDSLTVKAGAVYLFIIAIGFIPQTISLMMSTLLRTIGYAKYPMYASVLSVILNTIINYILIFGKCGFPAMGLKGAAVATTFVRIVELLIIVFEYAAIKSKIDIKIKMNLIKTDYQKQFLTGALHILWPILMCEFMWSLGENVYAVIYGRMGTDACAAMTLTNPVQSIIIGAFTGISSAAGIIIGRKLGENKFDTAYDYSKRMMKYGIIGTIVLGIILSLVAHVYVNLFNVSGNVKQLTVYILYAYAIIVTVKVQNMILGGGILRSGGNTRILMWIDIIGTWMFGIPLGLLGSYVLDLPIYFVYFMLSLEEIVRLVICLRVFTKRKWMKNIT